MGTSEKALSLESSLAAGVKVFLHSWMKVGKADGQVGQVQLQASSQGYKEACGAFTATGFVRAAPLKDRMPQVSQ